VVAGDGEVRPKGTVKVGVGGVMWRFVGGRREAVGDEPPFESSERRAVGGEMERCGRCFAGEGLGLGKGLPGVRGKEGLTTEAAPETMVSGRWYVAMKRSLVVSLREYCIKM
jgi:hypothetical protein